MKWSPFIFRFLLHLFAFVVVRLKANVRINLLPHRCCVCFFFTFVPPFERGQVFIALDLETRVLASIRLVI